MILIGQGDHGYRLPPTPPLYSDRRRRLPRWANMWTKRLVLFSYRETTYKIVSSGCHNNTPERYRKHNRIKMFVEYVRAVPVEQKEIKLTTIASLTAVQTQGTMFTPDMLAEATHIKWYRDVASNARS